MRLPHSVCEKDSNATKSKSPEVINVVNDAGSTLEEFNLIESGNQIQSYVKVKAGDEITLSYTIPGMEGQIIDVYIDGVLRETHITNASKTATHRGHVKRVCACDVRPSGAKGKMEYYYMAVEERKTNKDISPFSPNYSILHPSDVGTIEVRVLREMSLATDSHINDKPEQAIRGPNFEESLRWWNVSGRVDPGIIAPTYQIGFINGRKTQNSSRKNIRRSVDGYFLWASFKYFYRSAPDIEAAELKAGDHPEKLSSTSTSTLSAHLTESIHSKNLGATAAPSTAKMSAPSLESSTPISVHKEKSDLTSITPNKDRNDRETLKSSRSPQPCSMVHDGENGQRGADNVFSKNIKVENIVNHQPLGSLMDNKQSKKTPSQEYSSAKTTGLDHGAVANVKEQEASVKVGNVHEASPPTSQHGNPHDVFNDNAPCNQLTKSGAVPAISGIIAKPSNSFPSSIPSGRDANIVSEADKNTNVVSVQKFHSAQHPDLDLLIRAKAGHYMSRSPLVDKEEMEELESEAKAMTNGKGDWRNRAAKMLEVISAPIKDRTSVVSPRTKLPHEALTTHDPDSKLKADPIFVTPNKRKLDQLNLDCSSSESGSNLSVHSQLGQGMSPKQLREEYTRKKLAKQEALRIKMEEAATLRRQVEQMEAEQAAQQELELRDLDAETEKFEAEAQAWAARLRELSEE